MDAEDKTKGYIFMEYSNPACAQEAVNSTNEYKLINGHTFTLNLFSDYGRYEILLLLTYLWVE